MNEIKTKPEVFIIESLTFENESDRMFEGKIISDILRLSDKSSMYYYIRTQVELEKVLDIFWDSNYRYLHLSCHGNPKMLFTTLDNINFKALSELLEPVLENRRLFLSACSMTNDNLAKAIIPSSDCFSILGPAKDVNFNDAAVLWATFYHLMFKDNSKSMNRSRILQHANNVSTMFNVPLNYFSKSRSKKQGYSHTEISPKK